MKTQKLNPLGLRQQMIDELHRRNSSQNTIDAYVACVVRFAAHFGRSPSELGAAEILAWQLYLCDVLHLAWST